MPAPTAPDLTAPAAARPARPLLLVLLAPLAGLLVGVATSLGQTVLGGTALAGLANAVSPWLVAPFLAGSRARTRAGAALLGLLTCTAQVAGYYLTAAARGFGVGASSTAVWAAAALLAGPVFALAGRSWWSARGRERGLGAALLVAAWACEALVSYALVLRYADDAVVFGAVAALLAVLLGRRGRQHRALLAWLPLTLALGAAGEGALHALL
ncbi:DUF6518 family protein [Kineococcus sp. SYSU DK005]|uniref:DUF6518 family protein n=1 Tax=Kineococcus sp. SYSU DK005 TaxID=3383126 RepID=UPI003D7C6979